MNVASQHNLGLFWSSLQLGDQCYVIRYFRLTKSELMIPCDIWPKHVCCFRYQINLRWKSFVAEGAFCPFVSKISSGVSP